MLLLVAGLEAGRAGLDPDLQQVNFLRRVIELALRHAGTRAQPLHAARTDDRDIAEGILVLDLARQHIRQYLDVALRLVLVAFAGPDAVLVQDTQRPELLVPRIVIIAKRERMVGLQPAVIGVAPIQIPADFEHAGPRPRDAAASPARMTGHAPGA